MASADKRLKNRPPQPATDANAELVRDRKGSRVAGLFLRFQKEVQALLYRRLGNREDAREASQDVFLKLWQKEQSGELDDRAQGYLFTTADHTATDTWRAAVSRAYDRHDSIDDHRLMAQMPVEEDSVHWQRGLELVVESMKTLPAQTQAIFTLYNGGRMTYEQIAEKLGITSRTVERHMARALAHCRKNLAGYFDEPGLVEIQPQRSRSHD